MSAKFDEEAHNGLFSIMFTRLFLFMSTVTLTSQVKRDHPLTMVNTSAKLNEEAHNGLFSFMFTRFLSFLSTLTLTFDLQSQFRVHPLIMLTCLPSLMKKHHNTCM